MKVLDRFYTRTRGWVVVLGEAAKVGDLIKSGERSWPIQSIETFCIHNPPLPWGFYTGETSPDVGDEVTFEKGPHHESTPWPRQYP